MAPSASPMLTSERISASPSSNTIRVSCSSPPVGTLYPGDPRLLGHDPGHLLTQGRAALDIVVRCHRDHGSVPAQLLEALTDACVPQRRPRQELVLLLDGHPLGGHPGGEQAR